MYPGWDDEVEVESLLGKTLASVEINEDEDEVTFTTADGERYLMRHNQDCCESVTVEDVVGDLADLIGSPLTMAEAVEHEGTNPEGVPAKDYQYSWTWTFYKFATVKGYVTIRWYGASNGYYSESVDLYRLPEEEK